MALFLKANAVYEASEKAIQDDIEITDAAVTDGNGRIISIDFSGSGSGVTEQQVLALIAANVPTLAQVLEAGNNAGGTAIDGLTGLSIDGGLSLAGELDMAGNSITSVSQIQCQGNVDAISFSVDGVSGVDATEATTVTSSKGIVTTAT